MTTILHKAIASVPMLRHVKNHRKMWFVPAWMRDGYKSEAHFYHDRASVKEKFAALHDPTHPNHDLAVAAEKLKL